MGLIEQEIKEIRQLKNDLKAGKISHDSAIADLAFYSQTEKRAKLLLQAHALGAKFGRPVLNRIVKSNLIGNGVAIEAGDAEIEMIKCPDMDNKIISRAKCLDYSGENNETCQSCENFGITRKLLLPEK